MKGRWTVDRVHGEQFQAESTKTSIPATKEGLQAYLASGAFHKLGKTTAERLVRTFGTGVVAVIEDRPMLIADLPRPQPEVRAEAP